MAGRFCCLSFFLCLQLVATDPAFPAEALARLRVGGHLVEWLPQAGAEEIFLRLAAPDGMVRGWRFPAGTAPSLALFDERGQPLPDGLYTYELQATPRLSLQLRARLQKARAAGDEKTVRRLQSEIPGPLVQAGSFRLEGGAVLMSEASEPEPGPPTKDQMVPDDLVVDGKGCVGLGCANGESFGAEAMRLKQSVVRLRFEDTSGTAGFSTRDWQITVNDPGSGGGDRFSIDDLTANRTPFTIRGNAPDNALVIDTSGKLGLRTATPAQDVHIASGNTPAVRLEQTTTGGFPARTWDLAASDTGLAVKDVTNGSAVPFRIGAGAATGSLEVAGSGFVGVGTTSPLTRLHFLGTGNASGTKLLVENASSPPAARELFEVKNNGDAAYIFKNSLEPERWYFGTFAHNFIIDNQANGGVEYFFGPAGNVIIAGTLTQSSDRATKTDINPVDSEAVLAKVSQLPIATWRRIGDDAVHLGPMAQDFHSAFGLGDDDRHIAPSDLASVSLTAVQGLLAEVKEQRQTIEKQQELIRKLEERLARLEKQ